MRDGSSGAEELEGAIASYTHAPVFDPAEYRDSVKRFDITEEEKNKLLAVIWDIALRFVELGFGVDSMHNFLPGLAEFCMESQGGTVEETDNKTTAAFNENASEPDAGKDATP